MTAPISAAKPAHPPSSFFFRTLAINAVAVAIVGVAAAIFSSQTYAAIGYAILGISSGILWFLGSVNLELFQKMQTAMDQDVVQMQNANKKTSELTDRLAKEDVALKQNTSGLQAEVDAFKSQNILLRSDLKTMDGQLQRLQKNNQDLSAAKAGLEKDLVALQKSYADIQSQVEKFLSLNLQMGQTVGAFQNAGGDIVKTSKDLEGAVSQLAKTDSAVADLAAQMELGRKSVQQILEYVAEQEKNEKVEVDRLRGIITDLTAAQKDLSTQNSVLDAQVKTWAAKAQQIDKTSRQMADSEVSIGKTQEAIQRGIQELSAKREELAKENLQLQENEKKVEEGLKDLDGRIAIKQKQIADLNGQIREKLDQLKSLKGQIAGLQKPA